MKISEMTMDQATDAIVRMSKPVSNIMKDSEIESILKLNRHTKTLIIKLKNSLQILNFSFIYYIISGIIENEREYKYDRY